MRPARLLYQKNKKKLPIIQRYVSNLEELNDLIGELRLIVEELRNINNF